MKEQEQEGEGRPQRELTSKNTKPKGQSASHPESVVNTPRVPLRKWGTLSKESTEQGSLSELIRGEQENWQNVLGTLVDIAPLPDYVTPEVQRNLEGLGFNQIIYMPKLDLGSIYYLRSVGVDQYLNQLALQYPKWHPLESLSEEQRLDSSIPRNLPKEYWRHVELEQIDFPVFPGQWMAVETAKKPQCGKTYAATPFAERLGSVKERFNVSWNHAYNAIEREKASVFVETGLSGRPVAIRQLEAHEWNLAGNRFGWGKTDTCEWTNTPYRTFGGLHRLYIGSSTLGGCGDIGTDKPDFSNKLIGFRAAVILGS